MNRGRVIELILVALGVVIAAIALIPAFGQWLFPSESTSAPTTSQSVHLSELKPRTTMVGQNTFSVGKYNFSSPDPADKIKEGDPILAHGTKYPYGLYAHAPSKLTYELGGKFSEFLATITLIEWIDCSDGDGGEFIINLDGGEIFRSKRMMPSSAPENIKVDVTDGQILELITEKGKNDYCDWTIWGDPILR